MATIRAYTTVEQSRKLAEILPIESADMCFVNDGTSIKIDANPYNVRKLMWKDYVIEVIPCWSLAGLLGVLPPYLYEWEKGIDFSLYPSVAKKRWWCAGYISQDLSPENKDKFTLITHADNPIDACYEMILKLHELDLL